MVLIVMALLLQDPAAESDRLVRDLGDDRIDVRERAQRRLLQIGEPALPALDAAARSSDAEFMTRATTIAEAVRREARERPHDAEQKAALILLRRDAEAERRPGSGASEGARFDLTATPFEEGRVLTTRVTDYLGRVPEYPGRGQVRFEIASVQDSAGNELHVDRCGRCSPRQVFVWSRGGDLKVRLRGEQTWFSSYALEFKNPAEGQFHRVGDCTITVAWPLLRVTPQGSISQSLLSSMDLRFQYELKEGVYVPGKSGRLLRRGSTRAFILRETGDHWCDCPAGAQPVPGPAEPLGLSEFHLGRERIHSPLAMQPGDAHVEEDMIQLEHVSRITCTFWKPITLPIDVTVEVPAE
jgi:hypothetical protein